MIEKYFINEINKLKLKIKAPSIIFLYWDLWAGKTTISKYIINELLSFKWVVTSPTYVYYNKYMLENQIPVYHFDLYRISNYDEFFAIGGEEIFDNNDWIILVEWPEKIENYYMADIVLKLKKTDLEDERKIEIIRN